MKGLIFQIQRASDAAKGAMVRITGAENEVFEDKASFGQSARRLRSGLMPSRRPPLPTARPEFKRPLRSWKRYQGKPLTASSIPRSRVCQPYLATSLWARRTRRSMFCPTFTSTSPPRMLFCACLELRWASWTTLVRHSELLEEMLAGEVRYGTVWLQSFAGVPRGQADKPGRGRAADGNGRWKPTITTGLQLERQKSMPTVMRPTSEEAISSSTTCSETSTTMKKKVVFVIQKLFKRCARSSMICSVKGCNGH